MTLALVMAATTVPAQNVKAAIEVGTYELSDTSVNGKYDVTGDGVVDTIKFEKLNKDENGVFGDVKVIINEKTALSVTNVNYNVLEPVFIQTKEHGYILMSTYEDNDYLTFSRIYEYVDGKLKQRMNLDTVAGKIFYQYSPNVYDVKDEYIQIRFAGQSNALAKTSLVFKFKVGSTGTLSVANKTVKVSYSKKRIQEKTGGSYSSKYLIASKKIQVYRSSTGTKKAFTIKKGEQVKISKVSINGKTPRFYCTSGTGKKGWIVSKQNLFKDLIYTG